MIVAQPVLVIPLGMMRSEVCSPIGWTTSWTALPALVTSFLLLWPPADQVCKIPNSASSSLTPPRSFLLLLLFTSPTRLPLPFGYPGCQRLFSHSRTRASLSVSYFESTREKPLVPRAPLRPSPFLPFPTLPFFCFSHSSFFFLFSSLHLPANLRWNGHIPEEVERCCTIRILYLISHSQEME